MATRPPLRTYAIMYSVELICDVWNGDGMTHSYVLASVDEHMYAIVRPWVIRGILVTFFLSPMLLLLSFPSLRLR